jgi:hypothetical protein
VLFRSLLEYSYPENGNFSADEEKNFYFVEEAYDTHNYKVGPRPESFIAASGGSVISTVTSSQRNYTVHRYTVQGTFSFIVTDPGTFNQSIKFVVSNGSFAGNSGFLVESSIPAALGTYTVVVNSGGRVDVAYPQDGLSNDIPFNVINPVPISATGGSSVTTITVGGVDYRLHRFTTVGSSTFVVNNLANFTEGNTIEYLVVGGGGSGGTDVGGGGGAGGFRTGSISAAVQSYTVVVGAGAPPSVQRGGNSQFGTIISQGGGAGATWNGNPGGSGGSGGGGAGSNGAGGAGGAGTSGQGFNGSAGSSNSALEGGGGGGAGAAAGSALSGAGGRGGNGLASSITGTSVTYAGGGGGGSDVSPGAGGTGGGGAGQLRVAAVATSGTPNTGGGGGGHGCCSSGGAGGSGVVIVRYRISPPS